MITQPEVMQLLITRGFDLSTGRWEYQGPLTHKETNLEFFVVEAYKG